MNLDREFINAIFAEIRKFRLCSPRQMIFWLNSKHMISKSAIQEALNYTREYSHKPIADTIRESRENFEKATSTTKRQLLDEVEREIKNFRSWLEETKNLDSTIAYYIAVSLKGLLFGLPAGVQIAQLFDTILDKQIKK
ncbi:MAG: hypothetical protein QXK98_00010 [Candidatus Bathyarchaeia archaeon]